MTTVSILSVTNDEGGKVYQAVAGDRQGNGNTPGEALDAITAQLGEAEASTLVVLQNNLPDAFFSEVQRTRLALLMQKLRAARDSGSVLSGEERSELDALIQSELCASALRAKAMVDSLIK